MQKGFSLTFVSTVGIGKWMLPAHQHILGQILIGDNSVSGAQDQLVVFTSSASLSQQANAGSAVQTYLLPLPV